MPSVSNDERALKVFYMAHRFINEFGIRWLPVNPEDIIDQNPNWHLKYVSQLAYETGRSEQYILNHVMRSQDGLSMYDVKKDSYDIIINAADYIPPGRVLWTKMHEIGHIYLGHLKKYNVTEIRKEELSPLLYEKLEFEADMFAGEVLASKWLMRSLDVYKESDIATICGISDEAARNRYRKATENYSFTPANVTFTLHQFHDYLKEVAVCTDVANDEMLVKYAKHNTAQPKFPKPMAPFMRSPGICPYCGRNYSKEAKYCGYCGTALQKGNYVIPGVHCFNIQPVDTVYCEKCGNPVIRIRQGFCFEECEV